MLKLELPLEPSVLRVIAAVQAGAQAQSVEPLLVGAAARDLLLARGCLLAAGEVALKAQEYAAAADRSADGRAGHGAGAVWP